MDAVNVDPQYAVIWEGEAIAWFVEQGEAYRFVRNVYPLTQETFEVVKL